MSYNVYMSGTRVRSIAEFTDFDGQLADPDTREFKYRPGAGVIQTNANPTRLSLGTFYVDVDTSGWDGPDNLLYTCQWKGTGLVQAIGPDYFEVEPPAL